MKNQQFVAYPYTFLARDLRMALVVFSSVLFFLGCQRSPQQNCDTIRSKLKRISVTHDIDLVRLTDVVRRNSQWQCDFTLKWDDHWMLGWSVHQIKESGVLYREEMRHFRFDSDRSENPTFWVHIDGVPSVVHIVHVEPMTVTIVRKTDIGLLSLTYFGPPIDIEAIRRDPELLGIPNGLKAFYASVE